MARRLREVVFVDGVRTPFGKAKGQYAETRADDLVIKYPRAHAAQPEPASRAGGRGRDRRHHPDRRPGADHRPHRRAALGPAPEHPGYAIDRMCAGAMTAVTTTAGGIAFGSYDVVIAGGVEHMGRHPMGEGVDPDPRIISEKVVDPEALSMGNTAENLHDRYPSIKERVDAYAVRSQEKTAQAYADAKISPTWCRSRSAPRRPAGASPPPTSRRVRAPDGDPRGPEDPVPRARPGHRGQRGRHQRRRHRLPARRRGDRPRPRPAGGCAWSPSPSWASSPR